jgi:hypothetical protein
MAVSDTKFEEIKERIEEWLRLPYRLDEEFLMVEDELTETCIRLLKDASVPLFVTNCEEFDGDYRRWAYSVQESLVNARRGVLFIVRLNSLPEDVQTTLRAFWLKSMPRNKEQRLAFSFIPVNDLTAHQKRFNTAMPFFERRARGLSIITD